MKKLQKGWSLPAIIGLVLVVGAATAAVTALLGPERAREKQLRSAATEIIEFLRQGRDSALLLIGGTATVD